MRSWVATDVRRHLDSENDLYAEWLDYLVPTFADQEQLTEVSVWVQEVYRWRPVTPLGET